MFWKRLNQFCCKLAQVVHKARGWNYQLLESGAQRSRSHDAEVRFGHLVEASVSTLSVEYVSTLQIRWQINSISALINQKLKLKYHTQTHTSKATYQLNENTTWMFSGCVDPEIDSHRHLHALLSTPIDKQQKRCQCIINVKRKVKKKN